MVVYLQGADTASTEGIVTIPIEIGGVISAADWTPHQNKADTKLHTSCIIYIYGLFIYSAKTCLPEKTRLR
jgi:hypothetical protein